MAGGSCSYKTASSWCVRGNGSLPDRSRRGTVPRYMLLPVHTLGQGITDGLYQDKYLGKECFTRWNHGWDSKTASGCAGENTADKQIDHGFPVCDEAPLPAPGYTHRSDNLSDQTLGICTPLVPRLRVSTKRDNTTVWSIRTLTSVAGALLSRELRLRGHSLRLLLVLSACFFGCVKNSDSGDSVRHLISSIYSSFNQSLYLSDNITCSIYSRVVWTNIGWPLRIVGTLSQHGART